MKTKFDVLRARKLKRVSANRAAEELGISLKTLNQLMTIWGPHLEFLTQQFKRLQAPTNTKREQSDIKDEIAIALSVTKRQVNRLIFDEEIEIPEPISSKMRTLKRENAGNKRKTRRKYAIDVISGSNDIENAALAAEVSTRHIYRLAHQLCEQVGVNFRDLALLSDFKRRQLAKKLEKDLEDEIP